MAREIVTLVQRITLPASLACVFAGLRFERKMDSQGVSLLACLSAERSDVRTSESRCRCRSVYWNGSSVGRCVIVLVVLVLLLLKSLVLINSR